jgi:hypothetical protein
VKDDTEVDPLFARLLHFHWMEESQHARIDALELDKLLASANAETIAKAFEDYLGLIDAFDGLLKAQADMDARAIATALGRTFDEAQIGQIVASQHRGYRHTFLVYGMTNPTFLENLAKISVDAAHSVSSRAAALS